MKLPLLLVGLSLICGPSFPAHHPSAHVASIQASSAKEKSRVWQPASYKGLKIGQSTRADVVKLLGNPPRKDFADDPESPDVWYVYVEGGEFPGDFTVGLGKKSHRVTFMDLTPVNLTKAGAIERFGNDYLETRYQFCRGFEDYDDAPLYRTPSGNILHVEYPSRGISIYVQEDGMVGQIEYKEKPYAMSSERECKKALAKRRKESRR